MAFYFSRRVETEGGIGGDFVTYSPTPLAFLGIGALEEGKRVLMRLFNAPGDEHDGHSDYNEDEDDY